MKSLKSKSYRSMFGKFIKEAREYKGLSQTEAAELVGITQSYLSYLEKGRREIDLVLAMRLCDVVGVDMRDFINRCM